MLERDQSQWQIPILPYLIPPYSDSAFPNSGHYLEKLYLHILPPTRKGMRCFYYSAIQLWVGVLQLEYFAYSGA